MHIIQKIISISSVNVVIVYKHIASNVYIPSFVHTLRILPTAI